MDPHKSGPLNQPPPAHNMSGPQHPAAHTIPMAQPMTQRPMQPGYNMPPQPAHTGSAVSLSKPTQSAGLPSVAAKPVHPGGSSSPKPPNITPMPNPLEKSYSVPPLKVATLPSNAPPVSSLAKAPMSTGIKLTGSIAQQQQPHQQQQLQQSYQQMMHLPQQRAFQQVHQQQTSNATHASGHLNQHAQQLMHQNISAQPIPNQQPKQPLPNMGGISKVDVPKGHTPPVPGLISISKPPPPTSQALPATNLPLRSPEIKPPIAPVNVPSAPKPQNPSPAAMKQPLHIPVQAKLPPSANTALPVTTALGSSMAKPQQPSFPSNPQSKAIPSSTGHASPQSKPILQSTNMQASQIKPQQPVSNQPKPAAPIPIQTPITKPPQLPLNQQMTQKPPISTSMPTDKPGNPSGPVIENSQPPISANKTIIPPIKEIESKGLPTLTVTHTKVISAPPKVESNKEAVELKPNTLTITPKPLMKLDASEKSNEPPKLNTSADLKSHPINAGANLNGVPPVKPTPKPLISPLQDSKSNDVSTPDKIPSALPPSSVKQPVNTQQGVTTPSKPQGVSSPSKLLPAQPVKQSSAVPLSKLSPNQTAAKPLPPSVNKPPTQVSINASTPKPLSNLSSNSVPNQTISPMKNAHISPVHSKQVSPPKSTPSTPVPVAPTSNVAPLKPITNSPAPSKTLAPTPVQQKWSPPVKEPASVSPSPPKLTPTDDVKPQPSPKSVKNEDEANKETSTSALKTPMQSRMQRRRPFPKESPNFEQVKPPTSNTKTEKIEQKIPESTNSDEDSEEEKETTPISKRAARNKRKVSETPSEGERKSKRSRNPACVYQSPVPEPTARIPKSLLPTPSTPREKLVFFFKNEHVALRNAEGTFYICQLGQNVYKNSHKIKIRWLSPEDDSSKCDTYQADYYDKTDFECILTSVVLEKVNKGTVRLPEKEKVRIQSILQRAHDRDKGIFSDKDDVKEDHPLGLDLSLYNDESQLKKRKPKRRSKSGRSKKGESSGESGTESEKEELQNELEKDSEIDEEEEEEEDEEPAEEEEEDEEEEVEDPPAKVPRTPARRKAAPPAASRQTKTAATPATSSKTTSTPASSAKTTSTPASSGKKSAAIPAPTPTQTNTRRGATPRVAPTSARGSRSKRAAPSPSPPPATSPPPPPPAKSSKKESQAKADSSKPVASPAPPKTSRTSRAAAAAASKTTPAPKTTRRTRK